MRTIKPFLDSQILRLILVSVIAANIIGAIFATFMYPPLLSMPHVTSYILKLAVMLLLYIIVVIWATRPSSSQPILRVGTLFGITAGLLEIVHISVENFGHLDARTEKISTGLFMLGLFFLFAIPGYIITRERRNINSGIWAGAWSTVICMLIVVTYGLSQLFWSFQAIEKHDIGDPDFIRSGWNDMHAFVIADIFEASFKVLFLGPVVGIIFGLIGAAIAYAFISKKVQA